MPRYQDSTDNRALADVGAEVHLLEFALPAVQDIRGDEGAGILGVSVERKQRAEVGRELHGQAADANHEALVGLVEVVGGKAEVHLLGEADDAGAEVDLAHFTAARLVLRLVDEALARIDHVAEGQLAPVEGLLEVGCLETRLDGELPADGLLVAVDAADAGGAERAPSGPVVHHDEAEAARDARNVLVVGRGRRDVVAAHGRPLVPVVHDEPRAARRSGEGRIEVHRVRVELGEFRVLSRRGLRSQGPNASEHQGQHGQRQRTECAGIGGLGSFMAMRFPKTKVSCIRS